MKAREFPTPPASKNATAWYFAGFAIAFLGVFDLPWLISFPGPVAGESYSYGFYNPVAVPALCFALVPNLLGLFRSGKKPVALSWFVPTPAIFPPWRAGSSSYIVLGVATAFCAVAILVWNSYLDVPYWGESNYFLSNIDLVRLGYRPYVDFAFSYGPAFLYGPIALDRLSGGNLGIENAYAVCIALAYAVGFLLLFVFQRFLNLPDRDRPWILALTLLIWFLLTMGLQYTPLRFALAPCLLALGNHPSLHRTPGLPATLRLLGLVIVFTLLCFLVSPEVGIVCSGGFAASAAVHFLSRRVIPALAYLMGISLTAALVTGLSARYWHTISAMGGGAFCFPVFPNHANIILVFTALFVLPVLAYSILKQLENPAAPLAAAIGSAAVLFLPGALGRCDPGHVLVNGLLLFTLLFAALGQIKRSYLIGWGAVFALAFVVLGQVSYWNYYLPQWRGALSLHDYYVENPDRVKIWAQDWTDAGAGSPNYALCNWHRILPFPKLGQSLAHTKDKICTALGSDPVLDRYLKVRSAFIPSYYCSVDPEMFTPEDVAHLVNESRTRFDFMLVSDRTLAEIVAKLKQPPVASNDQDWISGLLVYPVRSPFRNDPYMPQQEATKALLPYSLGVGKDGTYTLIKLAK